MEEEDCAYELDSCRRERREYETREERETKGMRGEVRRRVGFNILNKLIRKRKGMMNSVYQNYAYVFKFIIVGDSCEC